MIYSPERGTGSIMGKQRRRADGEGTIFQRKDGLWQAELTIGYEQLTGKRIYKTVYGTTQKKALENLDKLKEDAREGRLEASTMTVWNALDWWLNGQKASIESSTYERYKLDLEYLKPYTTRPLLSQFYPLNVTHVYQMMEKDGLSDDKRHKAGVRLRQAMSYAVKIGLLKTNPAANVRLPKISREEIHPLTVEGVHSLLSTSRTDRLNALWVVALDSGARQGELFALEWADWDEATKEIAIVKSLSQVKGKLKIKEPKTKGSRRRTPLSEESAAVLRGHRERMDKEGHGSALIFPNTDGGWLRANNLQKYEWKPLLRRAGLPQSVRFHDLSSYLC